MSQFLLFLVCAAFGIVTWSLAEYLIHRFYGHRKDKKNIFTVEHMRHHRETSYFAPTYKKVIAAILVLLMSTLLFGLLFSWFVGFSFSLGFSSMYLTYEVIHRRAHTHGPKGAYGRWVRKHHFFHHFKNPKVNHGVTSPVWDIVFGTLESPEVVLVPRKLALDWLLDPATGEILPEFTADYQLRGGGTAKVL